MKKIIIAIIVLMNLVTVTASENAPSYKIIANSNSQTDIDEMYDVKERLLLDYKKWVKGVDDKYQVLADHQDDYHAKFYNGEYVITLGQGKGKDLTGKLKVSYCKESKDIEKKSLLAVLFGG